MSPSAVTTLVDFAIAMPDLPAPWLEDCLERGLSIDEARLRLFLAHEIDVGAVYADAIDRLCAAGFDVDAAAEIVEAVLPGLAVAIDDECHARTA